jgi:hypothetical protein
MGGCPVDRLSQTYTLYSGNRLVDCSGSSAVTRSGRPGFRVCTFGRARRIRPAVACLLVSILDDSPGGALPVVKSSRSRTGSVGRQVGRLGMSGLTCRTFSVDRASGTCSVCRLEDRLEITYFSSRRFRDTIVRWITFGLHSVHPVGCKLSTTKTWMRLSGRPKLVYNQHVLRIATWIQAFGGPRLGDNHLVWCGIAWARSPGEPKLVYNKPVRWITTWVRSSGGVQTSDICIVRWTTCMIQFGHSDLCIGWWTTSTIQSRRFDLGIVRWTTCTIQLRRFDLCIVWTKPTTQSSDLCIVRWTKPTIQSSDLCVARWATSTIQFGRFDLCIVRWTTSSIQFNDLCFVRWIKPTIQSSDLCIVRWTTSTTRSNTIQ